ncbi:hydrogenase expression/formation protein [Rhodopseudomonas sp. HC1]|uniref:hydrogenase expression/formation protein n=1 Tax=Rhodopseudomonas infernalis TaxID=2897386 RepID=UPI001EE88BE1|nr:hydrogenase expression/formation protein [Rhodopseudomonas infernalis]MCG6207423.1 hydrogenase expression/formation protein [Rhodopseudomonas infernalis]
MRVGYTNVAGSDDIDMHVLPLGHGSDRRGFTGAGTIAALATRSGDELTQRCPRLAAMLPELRAALAAHRADDAPVQIRLDQLDADELRLLADILGEGEVTGIVALPDRRVAQIQESVFAGLWRVRIESEGDAPALDYLEFGAIPEIAARAAQDFPAPDITIGEAPEGAMNVMPVLAEIRERMAAHRPGAAPQIINFTLLPMTPADMAHLTATLGNGPIQLYSRGYGSCRVLATGARHVWSVQYLNAMDTPILDTIEVGDVPAAVRAADEDFQDSAERLGEIIEAYFA